MDCWYDNPLTFEQPDDYDRILEEDRISVVGLSELAPGKPVSCIVRHTDGTEETISLHHTLNAGQIEWFKAGSAMNHMKNQEQAAG